MSNLSMNIMEIIKMLLKLQEMHLVYVVDIKIIERKLYFLLFSAKEVEFIMAVSEDEILLLISNGRKKSKIRLEIGNEIQSIFNYFNDTKFKGLDLKLFQMRYRT